ncbi:MAG TPA: elongation factor P, partial [Bacteroidales bacterium]|nr:elongation factor P [Bacteroidales bacterium]
QARLKQVDAELEQAYARWETLEAGGQGSFVRTKLKNLKTGKVIDKTFNAGAKVNTARIERRPYQYLYKDDLGYHFMHIETFEQVSFQEELINQPDLLKEGQGVEAVYHADTETPLYCELPPFVVLEVTYTEPGLKGDTSSSTSLKPARLETGAEIMVPLFVSTGDKLKVDTRDRSYNERVKE